MMEIPTKKDFYKVDVLRLLQPPNAHFSIAQYRSGRVNMKIVVDFVEFNENLVLFDESRNEEFTMQMNAWLKEQQNQPVKNVENGWSIATPTAQPSPPTKQVTLVGTRVIYFNGQERIVMMPIDEWEDVYFGYLEVQKLNI